MSITADNGSVTLSYCSSDSNYDPGSGHTFKLYSALTRNGSYQLVASIVNDVPSLTGQSSRRPCRSHTFSDQTLNRWYQGEGGITVDNDDWATSRKVCMGTCVTPTPTPTNTPVTPSPTPTNTPVTPSPTPTNTPVTPSPTPTNTPVTPTLTPTPTPSPVTPPNNNGATMTISASGGIVTLRYCSDSPDYNSGNPHTFHLYSSDSQNGSYRLVASLVNDNLVVSGQSSHCMPGRFNGQTLNRWYKGWGGLTNADPDYDWATSRKVCMGTCVTPTPAPTNTPITPSPTPTNTPVTPTVTDTPTPTPTNVPPTFGATPYSFSVAENAAINTSVGAVSATDQNGDEISYSIVDGNTAGKFGIGTTNGNITLVGSLDYETTASYSLTARANDGKADTDVTVAINVMDVNEPPDAPATPTVTAASQTSLLVTWPTPRNTGPAINDYDVQHRVSGSGSFADAGYDGKATETTITGLSANTTYQVQVRAKNDEGNSPWSDSGTGKTSPPPKLSTPTNLDVRPLPVRRAILSWDAVANASGYVVEIRKHGETAETAWSPQPSQSDTSYEIVLDNILSGKGLGDDPYAYQFRVKATSQSTQYDSSLYSEVVTIIDTPITKANGDSRNTTDGMGKATLEWTEISNILGTGYAGGTYSFRYRKISEGKFEEDSHGLRYWTSADFVTSDTTPYDSSTGITNLDLRSVYAIQLIYKRTSSYQVYAARDVYVWPSDRPSHPYGERIATYPLSFPEEDKVYTYRICENTFPDGTMENGKDRRTEWRKVVIHALEQWEVATDGLVTMDPELYTQSEVDSDPNMAADMVGRSKECTDFTEYIDQVVQEIQSNPEYGFGPGVVLEEEHIEKIRDFLEDLPGLADIRSIHEDQLNEIKVVDLERTYEELGPPDGRSLLDIGAFPELALDFGLHRCIFGISSGCVYKHIRDGTDFNQTADILLQKAALGENPPALPGGNETVERSDVRFNKCPMYPRSAYELLVHEAGHVWGIYGVGDKVGYSEYHPWVTTSRDTVMSGNGDGFRCSPHPFDIMAIYALYQVPFGVTP